MIQLKSTFIYYTNLIVIRVIYQNRLVLLNKSQSSRIIDSLCINLMLVPNKWFMIIFSFTIVYQYSILTQ